MPFEYKLESLNKLSQVSKPKHIKSLSNALYPGAHCPLFGATMAACEVEGLEALVVGTDECTYYTQAFVIDRTDVKNNFWSYAMEHEDVVFGSIDKIQEAIRKIYEKTNPEAMLLITSCVPEITGENFDALGLTMTEELSIPVVTVHTEHFRCASHIPGIENTLTALASIMEVQETRARTLNILGHRFGSLESSELFGLLASVGYSINLVLPSQCSVADIRKAPSAELNVVVDHTALALAKRMQEEFGVPFVVFDKYVHPQRIDAAYQELEAVLGMSLHDKLREPRAQLLHQIEQAKQKLDGKTFVYGNSVMAAFEVSQFLCELGMKPMVIQARDLYTNDDTYIQEILAMGEDPYVASIANIAPLRHIYPTSAPHFYIGHESPEALASHGITQVVFDAASSKLGYELASGVIANLTDALDGKGSDWLAMMGAGVSAVSTATSTATSTKTAAPAKTPANRKD